MPRVPPSLHYTKRRGYFTYSKGAPVYFGRDARDARRKFRDFLSKIPLPDQPQFVAEAIAHWLRENPGDWHEDMCNIYDGWGGEMPLGGLADDHLVKLVGAVRETHSAQTAKHVLSHATRVLKYAVSKGWLDRMPRPLTRREHPKVVKHPRDVPAGRLSDLFHDLDRSARTRRTAAICRFIALVGCRPKEACGLQWSAVDLESGTCVLGEHKTVEATGQTKTIYLTPQARAVIESQPTRAGHVFLNLRGRPFTPGSIRSVLRTRGLTGAYQLRHTFAQQALDQLPMEDVAKLLGHADLRMVQTYAQVRDPRARAAAQSLVLRVPERPGETGPQASEQRGDSPTTPQPNPRKSDTESAE